MYGIQGGFIGNAAGMLAGNPFGADFVIPQQRRQAPAGGPQLNPLQQTPVRLFPKYGQQLPPGYVKTVS